ncbi:MAG: cytochrome c [Gaiellaceae bacterium]
MANRPARRSPDALAALLLAVALVATVGAGLLGWAVGQAGGEETATITATVTAASVTETQAGEPAGGAQTPSQVYLAAGCASCHGENAEGTDVAPALAGHAPEQVRQQVRSPLAQMPAYSMEQLSDTDLEAIAEYIAGLEPMEEHVEPVELSEVLAIHHWMAISAIAAEDRRDALHHVGHIIDTVKGEHLEAMTRARELLQEGDLHEAEHLIEEMLAGKAEPELSRGRLALRLALTAVDQGDRAEAIHQMRHFVETAKGAEREKGQAVLAHLREGDFHGAEHGIADLLGIERD